MTKWIEFNIHDRVYMGVDRKAPTASQLEDMFAPFRTTGLDRFDLQVTGEVEPLRDAAYGDQEYDYTDSAVNIHSSGVQIIAANGGFRANGRREMLTTVLPLVDRLMVERGAAMIHAATVDYRGQGVFMPAWGGVGKTSTIAKLIRMPGVCFMGDDWGFISAEGEMLGYAKPMFIKPHHRPIYPHLFKNKKKPLVPVRLSRPIARLTTVVHPYITKYPQLARITRRWSPEHMMVTPQKAFPNAGFSTRAPLTIAIFVERYEGKKTVLREVSREWMVSRVVGNFNAEMTAYSREVVAALGATGLVPIERTYCDKAGLLDRALYRKPTFLLQVPQALSPDQASDQIVAHIQTAMRDSGLEI